ncbi:hypothetical protein OAS39_09545 [Pirellulales bacterium]|nr:hypothetical protein [Pirellulales bacterium]
METLDDRTMFDGGFIAAGFDSPSLEDSEVFEIPDTFRETSIPAYSSKPDAPATLYLDFNGHNGAVRGNDQPGDPFFNVLTPEFELVRGTSQEDFSNPHSIEVRVILEIWQAAAEKCAAFNVNVTTVDPGDFSDGKARRVAVAGLYRDCYRSMLQYR